jgi:hypothetical protein
MAMCTTLVLALPDFTNTFVLECDDSGKGIGIVLMQEGLPLVFTNKQLSEHNFGKSIYEKEMLFWLLYMLWILDFPRDLRWMEDDHSGRKTRRGPRQG